MIGTVQFGLGYGINGSGHRVEARVARDILEAAWAGGVRWLDTAPGYGDAEQRLVHLMGSRDFCVTTKVPGCPDDVAPEDIGEWVAKTIDQSRRRLGDRLRRILFHKADDLAGPDGAKLWDAASNACAEAGLDLGISAYDVDLVREVADRFDIAAVQMPGNALDQRVRALSLAPDVTLELRSVYLQGLLVGDPALMAARLPAAAPALRRWHAFVQERGMTPVTAALSVARGLPGGARLVMGVDSVAQIEALLTADAAAVAIAAPELAETDPAVIRPDLWRPAA